MDKEVVMASDVTLWLRARGKVNVQHEKKKGILVIVKQTCIKATFLLYIMISIYYSSYFD